MTAFEFQNNRFVSRTIDCPGAGLALRSVNVTLQKLNDNSSKILHTAIKTLKPKVFTFQGSWNFFMLNHS